MLALIKNTAVLNRIDILGQFAEGGWVDLPDGSRVSPAYDGWLLRGYELHTIQPADPVQNGYRVVSSSVQIVNGLPKWVDVVEPDHQSLHDLRHALKSQIDYEAEATRLRYITGGAGQAMTYQQKAIEAMACIADADPQPDDYPLLSAEIGITAETLLGVAQVVFEAHQGWRQIGGMIEGLRLGGKQAVDAADTVDAAQIAAQIVWP